MSLPNIVEIAKTDLYTNKEELAEKYAQSQVEHLLRLRDMVTWSIANPDAKRPPIRGRAECAVPHHMIVVQPFFPTTDPRVVGITYAKNFPNFYSLPEDWYLARWLLLFYAGVAQVRCFGFFLLG